jgi:hypothetical protein
MVVMCGPFAVINVLVARQSIVHRVIPRRADPGVFRIVGWLHGALRLIAREDIQVIPRIAVSNREGVISLRDKQDVTVLDHPRMIEGAVGEIESLQTEAIVRIDSVVIDLLEIGLSRHVAHIVLVRWKAGPIPGRCEDLDHEQRVRRKIGFDDVVDLAGGVAGATYLHIHVVRLDQFRRDRSRGPGGRHRHLRATFRDGGELAPKREVERRGLAIEYAAGTGDDPFTVTAGDRRGATERDNAHLVSFR